MGRMKEVFMEMIQQQYYENMSKELNEHWNKGSWGDNHIIVLIDTAEFKELYEKSYISRRSNREW